MKRLCFLLALLALMPAATMAAAPSASAPFPSDESTPARDVFQIARPSADHGSLEVVESGVRRLESLEEKLSVVAVVGGYHSGKSFMLNALNESFGTGPESGFEMTDSHRATTEGLWLGLTDMTSEVDGSRVALLDTEGFGAAGVAEAYDAQIFAVATLLASHLVYNSRNLITAAEVEYLETLARRAHLWSLTQNVKGTEAASNEPSLAAFPPLTWAVQDFTWDLRGEDPTAWLESFVGGSGSKSGSSPRQKDKKDRPGADPVRIGRRPLVDGNYTLLGLFREEVNARVFDPPATSRASLARLRDAPAEALDKVFLNEMDAFRGELLRSLCSRRSAVDAAPDAGTRGASLTARLRTLVDAARDGSLPELPSLWSNAWESRLVAAASAAALAARDVKARAALETSPPLTPDAFAAALAGARVDAERLFKTHLFGLERLWRLPLRETRGEMARRDAADAAAHDASVAATLRLAADDAKDAAARGIAAIARPAPPDAFRRDIDEVLEPVNAAFREKTRAYERCAASRGAARRAAREVADARDGAAAAAERDNAVRAAATLAAAVAAGTRAYDLEMTASTLSSTSAGFAGSREEAREDAKKDDDASFNETETGTETGTALGMPLRASSVSALDAMARILARRAFRDVPEAAGAAWTLETRDGVSRANDLESALERRGESWRRRNARLASAASEAVRADVVAFAEAETESFARSPIALPDALRNDTRALVAKSLETFDLWTSGFEDVPERARARASLAATLGDLAAAARDANAAAWAEALAPVGAAARDRLEAEPTCFRRDAGNARLASVASLASLASRLRACACDASPSVVKRRAAEAWLAAFEDAKDARTFFGKRTFLSSSASDTARKAGNMSPDALREVARAFAATDRHVASLRDAARARRRGVVLLAATFAAAAAFFLLLPATRSLFVSREDAPRRDRRRRSRTPPLALGWRHIADEAEGDGDDRRGAEADANPIAFAARQPLPDAAAAAAAASPVPVISISSSEGDDGADDGTDDGGFVDVSRDYTFDEAEATLRRSEEKRRPTAPVPGVETSSRPAGPAFFFASPLAVTVWDMVREIEGVRRGDNDAIEFMSTFGDHPDVHWLIPPEDESGGLWTDDPRDRAEYHERVLQYVHERTDCDDAAWRLTSYVDGVLQKYADSV